MAKTAKRSILTTDQQNHERARMMKTTGRIISQLDEYIRRGVVTVAGKETTVDTTRLAAWRLCLDRTVPAMSSTEITHKSEYEGIDTGKLIDRLAQLASTKPELMGKLQEAIGGKVIDGEVLVEGEVGDQPREAKLES